LAAGLRFAAVVLLAALESRLMIESPDRWIDLFVDAGADLILVQVESTNSLYRTVTAIKAAGARPGVVLNPATPVEAIREILPYVDQVLVMTVEPGFGGQAFVPHSAEKIRRVRELAPDHDIEVDGGIDATTAATAVEAGGDPVGGGGVGVGVVGGGARPPQRPRHKWLRDATGRISAATRAIG